MLYMDGMLHDLRQVYADVEVKVADPLVALRETVVDTSRLMCFAVTANKRNKLTFIAEPLNDRLAEKLDSEAGKVKLQQLDIRKIGRFFQSQYGQVGFALVKIGLSICGFANQWNQHFDG